MTPLFPPSADLAPEAKPRLDPAVLALCHEVGIDPTDCSDAALTAHDDAVEAWGERRDAAVARICRWAVENGARLPFQCPPRPPG